MDMIMLTACNVSYSDCFPGSYKLLPELHMLNKLLLFTRLEKEILDRYLDVDLKGNKDGLKVIYMHYIFMA